MWMHFAEIKDLDKNPKALSLPSSLHSSFIVSD